jgi:hypothetical protein
LRSTIRRRIAGGRVRRFAPATANRESMPSDSKRETLRYKVLREEPVSSARYATGKPNRTRGLSSS